MRKIWSVLSWRNWGIIRYNSILQNISGLFYIALTGQLFNLTFIGQVGLFFLFSATLTSYGYLINDLSDLELDRRHGKSNAFQHLGQRWGILIVLAVLVIMLLFALPFINRPSFVLIWLLWLATATFYSLPPLRLKESGLAGLVATIMAQQTLPAALLFAAFGQLMSWGALVFILYFTIRGISSDISHQMRDWSHDSKTGTTTFAVRYGYNTTQVIYAINLEIERLVLGGVMLLLLLDLPPVTLPLLGWSVALAWPLVLIYVPLFLLTAGRSWQALRQGRLVAEDPYNENRQGQVRDALHVIHHSLPSVLMPFYLACWLVLFYWPNIIFLLLLIMLYRLYLPERWLQTWPLRPLLAWLRTAKA